MDCKLAKNSNYFEYDASLIEREGKDNNYLRYYVSQPSQVLINTTMRLELLHINLFSMTNELCDR